MSIDREKILAKIRKLLALGNDKGATEAEAVSAVLKAQRLMAEYDVEEYELHSSDEEPIVETPSAPASRSWRGNLGDVIADNFRCKMYLSMMPPRIYKVVFYGYKSDAQAAAMAFNYLYRIGNRLANRHCAEVRQILGSAYGRYNSYVLGFVDGVRQELEKQSQALMIVVPPKVKDEFEEMTMYWSEARGGINTSLLKNCGSSFSEGQESGRDAVRARRMSDTDASGKSYMLGGAE